MVVAVIAKPMVPPISCIVTKEPDAKPDSWGPNVEIATMVLGAQISPQPRPNTIIVRTINML